MEKKVYSAANTQDAQIIKDQLVAAGFVVSMRGQALQGSLGELPLTPDTAPSLWVEEEFVESALKFLHELATTSKKVFPVWACSNCGETIEGNFAVCWSCQTPQRG